MGSRGCAPRDPGISLDRTSLAFDKRMFHIFAIRDDFRHETIGENLCGPPHENPTCCFLPCYLLVFHQLVAHVNSVRHISPTADRHPLRTKGIAKTGSGWSAPRGPVFSLQRTYFGGSWTLRRLADSVEVCAFLTLSTKIGAV